MHSTCSTNVQGKNEIALRIAPNDKGQKVGQKEKPEFKVKIPLLADLSTLPNPYTKHKKKGLDAYALLLNTLIHKSEQDRLSYSHFHSLSTDTLRIYFRGEYHKILKGLKDAEYITQYENPKTYEWLDSETGEVKTINSRGAFKPPVKSKSGDIIREGYAKRYAINTKRFLANEKQNTIQFREYVITDKKLIDKVNHARVQSTQRTIERYKEAEVMYNNLKQLTMNVDEARKAMAEQYDLKTIKAYGIRLVRELGKENAKKFIAELDGTNDRREMRSIRFKYARKAFREDVLKQALNQYNRYLKRMQTISVFERLNRGEYDYISISRDHKTGRLFHNLTMTPKDLKPFLRLGGHSLVEIDGSNAQWWLCLDLIKKSVQHSNKTILFHNNFNQISTIDKTNTNTIGKQVKSTDIEVHTEGIMLHAFSKTKVCTMTIEPIERELYTLEAMLEANTFRAIFAQKYNEARALKGRKPLSDGDVKMKLIKYILFGNPSAPYYKDNDIVKVFRLVFPNILNKIETLKKYDIDHTEYGYDEKDRWKCLPLELQSTEAFIFVKSMVHTEALFLTLHDAIVTNQQNLHLVDKTLRDGLKRASIKLRLGDPKYY